MSPKTLRYPYRNRILTGLDSVDLALISPHLEFADLSHRQRLESANRSVETVFFIETGLVSVVATSQSTKKQAEVGLIGYEGMTGLAVVGGSTQSPNDTVMQTAGSAYAIDTIRLRRLMDRSATLLARFSLFALSFQVQTAQALLANATGSVEQRLARWLVMAHDRLKTSDLRLTHETLSFMLGVRRPGVTIAVQRLEAQGVITTTRGVISIVNRTGLLDLAGEFYGVPEAEYERLFCEDGLREA